MSDYAHISWQREQARLRKSSSTTTAKSTLVRLELEITDPDSVGWIMSQIQEAMRAPKPPAPRTPDRGALSSSARLALPAPQLKLTDGRSNG